MDLLIGNRRYTGSKKALLNDIYESITPFYKSKAVFADLFAGTGAVSAFMLAKGFSVIINDNLRSNYVAYQAWFGKGNFNFKKLKKIVSQFNSLDGEKLERNYFSDTYGGKYFSMTDAKKIGYLRDQIEKIKLTMREKNILLTSLMYTTDKIANTVGHFEHFLSKNPIDKGVVLRLPKIEKFTENIEIYNTDANKLIREITCDVAYIDPPYNARQYINFYHVLENLITWERPTDFEGTSMKFKRDHLKSDYSKSKAPIVFKDLIDNLKAKLIVVSYNNTYSAKSSASNNKITETQLLDILSKKGKVVVKEIKHKSFNSGKTNFKNHKEILYICRTNI
ncbi:MAG: DNA adenine methylase [Candidatus Nomurabacteria bacterium]|nr:DNA adenine methylase [Candidatus Nomurabacteria bacterium]